MEYNCIYDLLIIGSGMAFLGLYGYIAHKIENRGKK